MSIHKEADGVYRIRWREGGKNKSLRVHGPHDLSKKILRKKLSARDENRHLDIKKDVNFRISALIDRYWQQYGTKKKSQDREKSILEGIRAEMGELFVREAEGSTVNEWYAGLTATRELTLASWLWMNLETGAHSRAAFLLPHCHAGAGAVSFLSAAAMWQAMSVAMMAPTTLNWLFAYAALTSRDSTTGVFRAVSTFLAGYFSVWLVYSAAAAAIQIALQRAGSLNGEGKLPPAISGLVLIGAGIAYFTPLSRACLRHCRNPMTYFASHWDNGPRSGFRFGAAHAVYCVGCCWLLMLTGFAMGVMNMIWMGLLTVLVAVEKLAPRGERIAAVAAAALILWGTALSLGIPLVKQ